MQGSSSSAAGGTSGAVGGSGRLNLRERLKKKMQNLLNKQCKQVYSTATPNMTFCLSMNGCPTHCFNFYVTDKADKKAEIEKTERERQQQQERYEEMRELAIKLRRR